VRHGALKKVKNDGREELRWGIERRLEFIDFLLFWGGRINRSDLTDRFGISTPQASADLARYQELAPANLVYDPSLKCYLATPEFRSVFDVENSDSHLAQLRSIASGTIRSEGRLARRAARIPRRADPRPKRRHTDPQSCPRRDSRGSCAPSSLSVHVETGAAMALDDSARPGIRRLPVARTRLLPQGRNLQGFRLARILDMADPSRTKSIRQAIEPGPCRLPS
jgi:hypothetical protein